MIVSIRSWNIRGSFTLHLSCPDHRRKIEKFHINLFQETHLRPRQHETVTPLDGYSIISRTRRPRESFAKSWGGVAIIYRSDLPCVYRKDLSGPDFIVLQLDKWLIYNVYLLPEGSTWQGVLEKDPCSALAASLIMAHAAGFELSLHGDVNGRTRSEVASTGDPERESLDVGALNSRGRWFKTTMSDCDMVIVNGVKCLGRESGKYTSFQGSSRTVIDYVAVSKTLWSSIRDFTVQDRIEGYDHAEVCVCINMQLNIRSTNLASGASRSQKRRKAEVRAELPMETELDRLYRHTLECGKDDAKKRIDLYGPVLSTSAPLKLTVHGVCRNAGRANAKAAAAVYGGLNSRNNCGRVVYGSQTSARAELTAMLMAMTGTPGNRTLQISTRSDYAIRSVAHNAAENQSCGWRCKNGDILCKITDAIRIRTAPVHFCWLRPDSDGKNGHLTEAIKMARDSCNLPRASQHPQTEEATTHECTNAEGTLPIEVEKVTADIPKIGGAEELVRAKRPEYPTAHRGRAGLGAIRARNRDKVLDPPSLASFWDAIRSFADPKPEPSAVTAGGLKLVFQRRVNPPEILPAQFDHLQYRINLALAKILPEVTTDTTAEQFFAAKWTEGDIEELNEYLRSSHSRKSAEGEDATSYSELREIPTEDVARLYNECIGHRSAPSVWLIGVMIGILKRGKPSNLPDSFRLAVMESQILKGLTILIHWRIRDWGEAYLKIPPWQNGFRLHHRTNNNPFILRCLKEWARAHGRTLYVAFVDFSNAFPSTDQPTLWLKLTRMGMGGPIFDWLRMLYREMSYYVRHGDMESERFKAMMGVLTGDPASPILWNLFLSDLKLDPDCDDIKLPAALISLLAQADDLILLSLSSRGLQTKLNSLERWCAVNFVLINLIKTILMVIGAPRAAPAPQLTLGSINLAVKTKEKYVGINFSSDPNRFLADHYTEKARVARYSGHGVMGTEDATGRLTPKQLKILYMARVDCHLIHGCEVMPDSEDVHVKPLLKIQINFLRQMLNVHSRSTVVILFTETGIMPLRPRRVRVLLGYLSYILQQPSNAYVRAALDSSIELAAKFPNKRSWARDLVNAISRLPFQCPPFALTHSTTHVEVEMYSEVIEKCCLGWLQALVDSSHKLYLLRGRLEPQKNKPPAQVTSTMRHYLSMVPTQSHREAISSVLMSTHQLAVEVLRYADHAYPQVPRERRLCRLCCTEVETPEHALLACTASVLVVQLRNTMLERMYAEIPSLRRRRAELTDTQFLCALIYPRATIALVAKFTYEALKLFYQVPVFRAE